jgi:hypothetical protein
MAQDWSRRVYAIADHYARRDLEEPGFGSLEAQIHGAGKQQFEAAQMASYMALVSLAVDVRKIAETLAAGRFR